MEQQQQQQQQSPVAAAQLLQHTLRGLCAQEGSQWIYAVFWRILPRNYPPPKWDLLRSGSFDRTRANRRNWILAWEEAFCDFAGAAAGGAAACEHPPGSCACRAGLQPELFFKMSHDIYSYGEGMVGKVAADRSHRWVSREPGGEQEGSNSTPPAWNNPYDAQPRTWEAQFKSGVKTIALIAVRAGVVQLGAVHKVAEDLSFVVQLRQKFSYLESIPGVLLPHPSAVACPFLPDTAMLLPSANQLYDIQFSMAGTPLVPFRVTPSMSSLEALLSKLPPVLPPSVSVLPPPAAPAMPLQPATAKLEEEEERAEFSIGGSSYSPLPHFMHG